MIRISANISPIKMLLQCELNLPKGQPRFGHIYSLMVSLFPAVFNIMQIWLSGVDIFVRPKEPNRSVRAHLLHKVWGSERHCQLQEVQCYFVLKTHQLISPEFRMKSKVDHITQLLVEEEVQKIPLNILYEKYAK